MFGVTGTGVPVPTCHSSLAVKRLDKFVGDARGAKTCLEVLDKFHIRVVISLQDLDGSDIIITREYPASPYTELSTIDRLQPGKGVTK